MGKCVVNLKLFQNELWDDYPPVTWEHPPLLFHSYFNTLTSVTLFFP